MKIDFMSDLHIDFYINEYNPETAKFERQLNNFIEIIGIEGGDAIVIPGDLGHYFKQNSAFLLKMKEMYKHVIFVPGNHDRYLVSKSQQKRYMNSSTNRVLELKNFCRENNIIYLDGDVVSVDGVTFAGTGMSWDKSYLEHIHGEHVSDTYILNLFERDMNDSNLIMEGAIYDIPLAYGGIHKLRTFDPFELQEKELEKLSKIQKADNVDVFVSHYSPVVPPDLLMKYRDEESTTFYFFDGLDHVKRIKPKYWLFGHTHVPYDFKVDETRMLCNPCGYPSEGIPTKVESIVI